MKEIKILLVDDHKLIRDGLKSIINTSHNIKVINECVNGKEAINYLKDNATEIDVILMDITMPEMNGIDATEIIVKLYPSINILALTMHVEEAYIMKMVKAGARGYVLKNTGRDRLIDAIQTVYLKEKYYSNEVSLKLINNLVNEKWNNNKLNLSHREIDVLKNISEGKTNELTGEILNISKRTVETHRRNIIRKLNVKNTAEMVSISLKKGLI